MTAEYDGLPVTGRLEYDVKAALLYRALELVKWPEITTRAPASLRVGILGQDQFGRSLDWLKGKRIAGRKVVVSKLSRAAQASRCQSVFISASESEQTTRILESLAGLPILTIGETPEFSRQGGIINLLLDGRNIRLEVNQAAAEKARLAIDPKLVKLAAASAAATPSPTNSPPVLGPKN